MSGSASKREIFDFHCFMYDVESAHAREQDLLDSIDKYSLIKSKIEDLRDLIFPRRKCKHRSKKWLITEHEENQKFLDSASKKFYNGAHRFFTSASKATDDWNKAEDYWNRAEGPAAMFKNIVKCHGIFLSRSDETALAHGRDFIYPIVDAAIEHFTPANNHNNTSPELAMDRILTSLEEHAPDKEIRNTAARKILEGLFTPTLVKNSYNALSLLLDCDNAISKSCSPRPGDQYYQVLRNNLATIIEAEDSSCVFEANRIVEHQLERQCLPGGYPVTEYLENCRVIIRLCAPVTSSSRAEDDWNKCPRRKLFIGLTELARRADMMDESAPFANQIALIDTVSDAIDFQNNQSTALNLASEVVRTAAAVHVNDYGSCIAISIFERAKDNMDKFPIVSQIGFIHALALANLDTKNAVINVAFQKKLEKIFTDKIEPLYSKSEGNVQKGMRVARTALFRK